MANSFPNQNQLRLMNMLWMQIMKMILIAPHFPLELRTTILLRQAHMNGMYDKMLGFRPWCKQLWMITLFQESPPSIMLSISFDQSPLPQNLLPLLVTMLSNACDVHLKASQGNNPVNQTRNVLLQFSKRSRVLTQWQLFILGKRKIGANVFQP